MKKNKPSITVLIFIGMIAGVIAGFIFGETMGKFEFISKIWMNALKISIAPIVFVMLALSIGKQKNAKRIGKIAIQILAYYFITTFLASTVGILVSSAMNTGANFPQILNESAAEMESVTLSFSEFFLNMVPNNFLAPLAETNMLQVLVLSALSGFVILRMPENEFKGTLIRGMEAIRELFNGLLKVVLTVAPIGIFFAMAAVVGKHGGAVVGALASFSGTFLVACLVQMLLVYGLAVLLFAKKNPFVFLKNIMPSVVVALSTSSSVLVIPSNLKVCNEKYDVNPSISDFTIPLGATINLDGAAIFFPCVIVFTAQAAGLNLSFGTLLYMAVMGSLIASSGGGIFGGALVKLMIMCELFAVPNCMVAMIASIFALLDMIITVVNVGGDVAGTIIVSEFDKRSAAREAKKLA
ncbi:MAG: dicarboxylate/amino acid:cation symporter [Candidatus Pelethousia sp.]|nr:dicarboxylate/amino acid:cation symporter [Candidatus Pelethousia sp.]